MATTRSKGTYYTNKTMAWLERHGYQCEKSEKLQRITKGRSVIWGRKDIFGADVIATNGEVMLFCQSKLGRKNINQAVKEFVKYKFPPEVKKVIFVWEKRNPVPELIWCKEDGRSNPKRARDVANHVNCRCSVIGGKKGTFC